MSSSLTILVTGATTGIGRHAALHLARAGHRVIATGRREEALASLLQEARGTALETLRLDVTDAASIAAAKAEVDRRTDGRGLDVLVNNAGYGLMGPMEEIRQEDLRAQYETNVFGLVAVTQAFVGQMRARGSGRIINVSSVAGRVTFPFFGAYNSTKYAVESLSDAMRVELAPFGVRVVLIEPGTIRSEFADRAMQTTTKIDASSPYAPIIADAERIRKQFEATEVGPEVVSRAIEKAATKRRPAARYVAPRFAVLMVLLVRLFPTSWVDAAFRAAVGLNARRLRLGASPSTPMLT